MDTLSFGKILNYIPDNNSILYFFILPTCNFTFALFISLCRFKHIYNNYYITYLYLRSF